MEDTFWNDADLVSVYTRSQAIEDGELVDVSQVAREAGFKFPVALTSHVNAAITPSEADERRLWQSYSGRLWDVLSMARFAAQANPRASRVSYLVIVDQINADNRRVKPRLTLVMDVGPGDAGEPVITIGFAEDF